MAGRSDLLLGSINVATSKGLELGPLASPVVHRDMGDIRYVDHVDTEALRARYATHDGFDVDAIVPIDYASHGRSIRDTVSVDVPFDYAIASHVIEHVPDFIGWLRDIHSVLRNGGLVALAIPDHRRCFDALRSPTVPADVIHAHLTAATVPSPRQVFDHYSSAVSWHGLISWAEEPPFAELTSVHSETEAFERAAAVVTSGDYDDVHCWVFTPSSFTRLFAALQRLQLVSFSLDTCSETVNGEFFATLRAVDCTAALVPLVLDDGVLPRASEHAAVRSRLQALEHDSDAARHALRRMLANRSRSLTRPLRSLTRLRTRRR